MPHQTNIVVNLRVPGIHRWKDCPIPEVAFLKDFHRHVFHIRCEKIVKHDDRDVEIIMFKRRIRNWMSAAYGLSDTKLTADDALFFDGRSCEHIAKELLEHFDLDFCEVLEDGENGAVIYRGNE